MRFRGAVLVGTVALFKLVVLNAQAQIPTGAIDGRVTDIDGALLPGVAVRVGGPALLSDRSTVTGATGAFRIPSVPPSDEYTVTFSLAGFQTLVRDEIKVVIGATTTLNIQLELGAFEEVLTVTGDSPVVDVKSTNLGVNVHETMLQTVPNARDIYVVLEETPAMVMDRFNVGGSTSGQQSRFSAGAGPSQTSYNFDGVNITDMAATGAATYFPYDAFQEIQVSSQSHTAEISTPGVHLNIITKSGSNQFHGMGAYYFQNASFQGNNITQDLIDAGVEEGDEFKELNDYSLSLGGPILRDKLTFFIHHSMQEPAIFPIGFTMPDGSRGVNTVTLTHWMAKLDWQISTSSRLAASDSWRSKLRPYRNAQPYELLHPGTLWYQDSETNIPQVHFSHLFSDRAFLDVSYGQLNMDFPIAPDQYNQGLTAMREYRTGPFQAEPLPNWAYGYHQSYYYYNLFERDRRQANASFSYFLDNWIGGDHELKGGLSWFDFESNTLSYSFGGLRLGFRYGLPYNIEVRNYPNKTAYAEQSAGFFIQDTATFGRWTVNFGLRGDAWELYLPEQNTPDTPHCDYFGNRWEQFCARSFPAQRNIVEFFNVAPRLGVVWDLFGNGRTAFKASFGRYYNQIGNWLAEGVNPNAWLTMYIRWYDDNGDNMWQPGEEADDPYSINTAVANSFDPNLKQPYTDELTFSLDQRIIEDLSFSAYVTIRKDKDLMDDIDLGKPYSAYTPVEFIDPEIGPYIVYELDEDLVGTPDQWYLTNPGMLAGRPFENSYEALTLKLTKRFSNNWHMMTSYTYSKTMGWRIDAGNSVTSVGDSPNDDLYAYGRPFYDRPHLFKLSGSYTFPWGMNFGAFVRYQSGERGIHRSGLSIYAWPRGSGSARASSSSCSTAST
jgi:hypothetical protein